MSHKALKEDLSLEGKPIFSIKRILFGFSQEDIIYGSQFQIV